MIPADHQLTPGSMVRLPSGRHVVLIVQREDTWLCEYIGAADARGEVLFATSFIRAHAQLIST